MAYIALPFKSQEQWQSMTPVYHLLKLNCAKNAWPKAAGAIYDAGSAQPSAAFPTTILLPGIPLAIISLTDVLAVEMEPPDTLNKELAVLQEMFWLWPKKITLQKEMAEPANLCTCTYPPLGKEIAEEEKQVARGECVMMRLGAFLLRASVKVESQASALPKVKEKISFQFISTPSQEQSVAYLANAYADLLASYIKAGNQTVPNTPSINLMPLDAYSCFILALICALLAPKGEAVPKQKMGSCQTWAILTGPNLLVQTLRQMWVQMWLGAYPGIPSDLAMAMGLLQSIILQMQVNRTGNSTTELLVVVLVVFVFVVFVVLLLVVFPVMFELLVVVFCVILVGVVMLRRFRSGVMAVAQMVPLGSEEYCQNMTPACHRLNRQFATIASAILLAVIKEAGLASIVVAALPTTILLLGTPRAIIQFTEVPAAHPPEALNKPRAVLQGVLPWLQNCTLQNCIIEPTLCSTAKQPLLGQSAVPPKQGAWGACVMIAAGSLLLNTVVRLISHSSPLKALLLKAAVSYQSMSTPSKLLLATQSASFKAQVVAFNPIVVGFQVAPKALTITLIPLLLQILLILARTSASVEPNTLVPKQVVDLFQRRAASSGPSAHVQKVKQTKLYR